MVERQSLETSTSGRIADRPPEARGLRRDDVRLLVAGDSSIRHARFRDLASYLRPGDLLVVNTSPTMPAAVDAWLAKREVVVHFSTRHTSGHWTVELRRPDNTGPVLDAQVGEIVRFAGVGSLELSRPVEGQNATPRLWRATVSVPQGVAHLLRTRGRPIRYGYIPQPWPIETYQTIFADRVTWPGSAEMPSAGRPFTWPLVQRLRRAGVGLAGISLHAGVASQETHEPPQPEPYSIPLETARAVERTRTTGGRIIAVGTTVTRALETVALPDGRIRPGEGWTSLVLTRERPTTVIDGIITGWHEPEASHLSLLQAVAGESRVEAAYQAAIDNGYLWHEFGDACLLQSSRPALSSAA